MVAILRLSRRVFRDTKKELAVGKCRSRLCITEASRQLVKIIPEVLLFRLELQEQEPLLASCRELLLQRELVKPGVYISYATQNRLCGVIYRTFLCDLA